MKKLFGILVIAIAIGFAQNANAQSSATANFNLSMTVDKYIEAIPAPINFSYGTTSHLDNAESLDGGGVAGIQWQIAYANCPFSITFSGNNQANQGKPRFAMKEVGTQGAGYDFLNTFYQLHVITNGVTTGINGDGNWGIAAKEFPYTQNILEAPHNGQVAINMYPYVNMESRDGIPVRQTLINSNFTNEQSADAGLYTCSMVMTLTSL